MLPDWSPGRLVTRYRTIGPLGAESSLDPLTEGQGEPLPARLLGQSPLWFVGCANRRRIGAADGSDDRGTDE
jgi:hypothetical protein